MFLIVISQPFRKYIRFLNIMWILKVITVLMGSTYYGTPCTIGHWHLFLALSYLSNAFCR